MGICRARSGEIARLLDELRDDVELARALFVLLFLHLPDLGFASLSRLFSFFPLYISVAPPHISICIFFFFLTT